MDKIIYCPSVSFINASHYGGKRLVIVDSEVLKDSVDYNVGSLHIHSTFPPNILNKIPC